MPPKEKGCCFHRYSFQSPGQAATFFVQIKESDRQQHKVAACRTRKHEQLRCNCCGSGRGDKHRFTMLPVHLCQVCFKRLSLLSRTSVLSTPQTLARRSHSKRRFTDSVRCGLTACKDGGFIFNLKKTYFMR